MQLLLYELRAVWITALLSAVAWLWFRWRGLPDVGRLRRSRLPTWLAALVLAWLVATSAYYVTTPSFRNNFEPVIATDSILMALGKPVYMGSGTTELVSTQYGPVTFLLGAALFDAGLDPILASKLGGAVHCLLGLAVLWLCAWRRYGAERALRLAGLTAFLLMTFGYMQFWNRPDSLHVLGSAVVAGSVLVRRRWPAAVLAGVGTGAFLFGAKFMAVLYVLPLVPVFLRRHGARATVAAVALAVVLGALPFAVLSSVSLTSYVEYIVAIGKGHSFLTSLGLRAVAFGTAFAVPLLLGAILLRRRHGPEVWRSPLWWGVLVHLGCTAILCVPAAKAGSGPHQLLGLLAPMVVQLALIAEDVGPLELRVPVRLRLAAVATGFLGLIAMGCFREQRGIFRDFQRDRSAAARAELEDILDRHAGRRIHMGSGGDDGDEHTYLRPLVVARTGECLFDPAVVLDIVDAGLPVPAGVYDALRTQRFDLFVIPAGGEPFSLGKYRGAEETMFPAEFRQLFLANYTRAEDGRAFDVWKARRLP